MVYPNAAKVASTPAAKVLQARALQCSFSSVFHLQRAGMDRQQAKFLENMFMGAVGGPLALMGITGGALFMFKKD